jgi:hypothetical protein
MLSALIFVPLERHAGHEVSGRRPTAELDEVASTITEAD